MVRRDVSIAPRLATTFLLEFLALAAKKSIHEHAGRRPCRRGSRSGSQWRWAIAEYALDCPDGKTLHLHPSRLPRRTATNPARGEPARSAKHSTWSCSTHCAILSL